MEIEVLNPDRFRFISGNEGLIVNIQNLDDPGGLKPTIGPVGSGSQIEYSSSLQSVNGNADSKIVLTFNSPQWPQSSFQNLKLLINATPEYRFTIRDFKYFGPYESMTKQEACREGTFSAEENFGFKSVFNGSAVTSGDYIFADNTGRVPVRRSGTFLTNQNTAFVIANSRVFGNPTNCSETTITDGGINENPDDGGLSGPQDGI